MSQGMIIIALFTLTAFGAFAVAMLAILSGRLDDREEARLADAKFAAVDDGLELHRIRMFLRENPEWDGRDFMSDPESPWHAPRPTSLTR